MKKLLPSLLLFVFTTSAKAQWVTIPDTNFVTFLQSSVFGVPACMNGNQLDTTCPQLLQATDLLCSHAGISDLTGVQYFKNITNLDCSYNQLTCLPPLPATLLSIEARENFIDSITAFPPALEIAAFYNNRLTHLPTLPSSLTALILTFNHLTALPALPNSITNLVLTHNQLTTLPTLPLSLRTLYCAYNSLTGMPTLPDSLENFDCSVNSIPSFPNLPDSLKFFYCWQNQLTAMPPFPASLRWLRMDSNFVSLLPPLPDSLKILECSRNPIQQLTTLPPALEEYTCTLSNQSYLPPLPNTLTVLNCAGNQITVIDTFPRSLNTIAVGGNPLTDLPSLPDVLSQFSCRNTPTLTCLPRLTTIDFLNFSGTGVTCLPNYGNVNNSVPALSSVPLCGLYGNNTCPAYWNISGRTYFDSLGDCLFAVNDTGLRNIKLSLYTNGSLQQQVFTGGEGLYSFDALNAGNYSLNMDTTGLPFNLVCPPTGSLSSTISTADPFDSLMDFSVECKPGFDLGTTGMVTTWGRFVPAHYVTLALSAGDFSNFWGARCATGISGQIELTYSGPASFQSASGPIAPSSVVGNTVVWNIPDFGTINFMNDFSVLFKTDTTALMGQQICLTLSVTPTTGDNNPSNNSVQYCYTVASSYDPNEKEVYPAANISPAQKELTYTIHFQNTGTAEAEHIYVDDTLDTDVDASTFQLLAFSHQPVVQLKGNTVRFNFPNINLPDSNTNEPLSHGYVQYKIKLKDNLPIGTTINNTAYIYFDFNAPVVTNTTTNTISTNTGIQPFSNQHSTFSIYPNPASNRVNIAVTEDLLNSTLTLTDITGRQLATVLLTTANRELSTDGLANGVYFASISNGKQNMTSKLIIQH